MKKLSEVGPPAYHIFKCLPLFNAQWLQAFFYFIFLNPPNNPIGWVQFPPHILDWRAKVSRGNVAQEGHTAGM